MIKFLDLQKINGQYSEELKEAASRVIDSGWYLQGKEVEQFEQQYAAYIGTRLCVGVGNGLDALTVMLWAYIQKGMLQAGDEVIVPANTFLATVLAITDNGLKPVFVEPSADTLQIDGCKIEAAITPRTRAVMIVHLYGRCAYTAEIADVCQRRGLLLFEDNAQAQGCLYGTRRTGSLSDCAAHSFYPGKNLGALGDAGAITTDDEEVASLARSYANYGFARKYYADYQGRNTRLDEMQAAMLSVKLAHLDDDNERRRDIARYYIEHISNPKITALGLMPPNLSADDLKEHVFHIFPIFCKERDNLQRYLHEAGVQTLIHYPVPPHKQKCYAQYNHLSLTLTERLAAEELSLPISPAMTVEEAAEVVCLINAF